MYKLNALPNLTVMSYELASCLYSTPVGELRLVASEKGLVAILWPNDSPLRVRLTESRLDPEHPILTNTKQQLAEYFDGKRRTFEIPLDFRGTDFQKEVWNTLLSIPYGETRSYGQLAKLIHREKASRAVGAANGRNPISIIAPCHRVIGSSGALTGFAGGLKIKTQLLALESELPAQGLLFPSPMA